MGLYDRDYGRDEGFESWNPRGGGPQQSMTVILIIVNVVILFADYLSANRVPGGGLSSMLANYGAVDATTLLRPWMWWQFLSYGFLHDIGGIKHILFNMFGLFIFGRMVEQRLGRHEFLRFYLVSVVFGGIVGSIYGIGEGLIAGSALDGVGSAIGASGAVVAVVILFACYYPHTELLLFFVVPVKAWILALVFVGIDLLGALGLGGESNTAFQIHLAGAAFAAAYYYGRWNLSWLRIGGLQELPNQIRRRSQRARLKIHDPDKKVRKEADEADRILAKIYDQGEESLTSSERKTLERYSRRQRDKRNEFD